MISAEEKFRFDLEGYLVVRNALAPDEVAELNRIANGILIIFTEALVHGTRAWTADHECRALLYKYSPGHSAWSESYYRPGYYPDATEQQLRIMAAPSVGSRPDSIQED